MDSRDFRSALGSFVTGVTVITTRSADGVDYGITANSFNSVSLDPPLVLWSLARTSASLPAFAEASRFAVHVLASDQVELSARFAQRGTDKFAGLDYERGADGVPLLAGCSARFVCRPAYAYEGGDHVIFVGEVLDFDHRPASPLAFHGGNYAVTAKHADDAQTDAGLLTHLVQSCYFHLLTPVRDERERLAISLPQHYLMSSLFAEPDLDIAGINAIVGYTGVRVDGEDAAALAARGLIEGERDDGSVSYRLTEPGREAVIGLIGASVVMEGDLAVELGADQLRLLTDLLDRVIQCVGGASPEPVHRHLALLQDIQMSAR